MKQYEKHVFVCELGGNCSGAGSTGYGDRLKEIVAARGLVGKVRVTKSGCIGGCGYGPNVVVYPEGIWYYGVQPADLERIIDETVIGGRLIPEKLFHKHGDPSVDEVVKDPVCGTIIRTSQAACKEETAERTVYFCCEGCRQAYLADPAAYASSGHGHHGHHGAPVHAGHHHH